MLSRRAALLSTAALPFVGSAQAQQQQTLRIAMTVADIPATDGAPDQGTEGIRFMGYTLYDPLIMWDLSSATAAARLVPGLATKWYPDPADPTKWIFELRQGVKFHDGSTFNADAVIFTLDRALDEKSPSFDRVGRNSMIASLWPIAAYRKIDDYKVELTTKGVDTLMPSLLNRIMIVESRQLREGRQGLAGLSQVSFGHRAVEDEGLDAARARRARAQHRLLEQGPCSQDRAPGGAADPRRLDAHRGAAGRPRRLDRSRRRPIRSTSSRPAAARSKPTPSRTCGPTRSAWCRARRRPTSACARR